MPRVMAKLTRRKQRLFDAQRGRCHWCGEAMILDGVWVDDPRYATREHLVPRSKGGTSKWPNIVLAHGWCNNRRESMRWPHDPVYK